MQSESDGRLSLHADSNINLSLLIKTALIGALIYPPLIVANQLDGSANTISPARKIIHRADRDKVKPRKPPASVQYRTIDGSYNNLTSSNLGASHEQLTRLVDAAYTDGIASMAGPNRPSARDISNHVVALAFETESLPNKRKQSDFLWQWGQFVDHDIDLTDGIDPPEPQNITVPVDDAYFLPGSEIPFNRSIYDSSTGINTPRQQLNEITAWIDASNVYGSDSERANAIRTLDGSGKLKTSAGNLLPFNTFGLANAGDNGENSASLFLAGDVRANEQIGLTVMHTLFMREHNRLVDQLSAQHLDWDGEKLYQKARLLVGAQMQAITFNEFLPALLGEDSIAHYRGYNSNIDPNISNLFSTAAYRFGHSALSSTILRLDAAGNTSSFGDLPLRNAFFSPWRLAAENGIEPILRGLAAQQCQTIDTYLVEDVRSFLFGNPAAGGFDLAALNIQRGRDHGLPAYNDVLRSVGLIPAEEWHQITSDVDAQRGLREVYSSVDDVDVWVGGLAEDPLPGSHLGLLFTVIIKEQFEALRDGDRFWYQRVLNRNELGRVENTTLADIIRRNTSVGDELPDNVFTISDQATDDNNEKVSTNNDRKNGQTQKDDPAKNDRSPRQGNTELRF